MPSPKRWFPVSHDLPTDPDVWDFVDEFGLRSLWTWLWILSRVDQGHGVCRIPERELVNVSRALHQTSASIRRSIGGMLARSWIVVEEVTKSGWPEVIRTPNYLKYHRQQDVTASQRPALRHPIATPSEPSYPNHPNQEKKERSVGAVGSRLKEGGSPVDNSEAKEADGWVLPETFLCTEPMAIWARQVGCQDPQVEYQRFRTYHTTQQTRSTNWMTPWRNWIQQAVAKTPPTPKPKLDACTYHQDPTVFCHLPASIFDHGTPRCRWHKFCEDQKIEGLQDAHQFKIFRVWLTDRPPPPFKTTKSPEELWHLANQTQTTKS